MLGGVLHPLLLGKVVGGWFRTATPWTCPTHAGGRADEIVVVAVGDGCDELVLPGDVVVHHDRVLVPPALLAVVPGMTRARRGGFSVRDVHGIEPVDAVAVDTRFVLGAHRELPSDRDLHGIERAVVGVNWEIITVKLCAQRRGAPAAQRLQRALAHSRLLLCSRLPPNRE